MQNSTMLMQGKRLILVLLLFGIAVTIKSKAAEHVLFSGGKTDYVIVIPENATEAERYASTELQYWMELISKAKIPIQTKRKTRKDHCIIIKTTGDFKNGSSIYRYPTDSYVYRNEGWNVVIEGGQRGVIYGVYALLKNELGCRWFTKDLMKIHQR